MISMYFSKITTTALFEIGGFLKIKEVIFYGRGTILIPTFLIIHSISVSSSPFYFYFRSRALFWWYFVRGWGLGEVIKRVGVKPRLGDSGGVAVIKRKECGKFGDTKLIICDNGNQ